MTKTLILCRHAEAEPIALSGEDIDRDLTKAGKACIRYMGQEISHILKDQSLTVDLAFCSSANRTKQTWMKIEGVIASHDTRVEYSIANYEAQVDELYDIVTWLDDEFSTVMLIGHNPGTENLANLLVQSDYFMEFSTSSFAIIQFPELVSWSGLPDQVGELVAYETPEQAGWSWQT